MSCISTFEMYDPTPVSASIVNSMRGTVVLEPGGLTMRAKVGAQWPVMVRGDGPSPLLKGVAAKRPTGIVSVRSGNVMGLLISSLPAEFLDEPHLGGSTSRTFLKALTGDHAGYVLYGEPGGVFENFEGKRANAPALSRIATEIIGGEHFYAAWGTGSALNGNFSLLEQIPNLKEELANPEAQLGIWALLHLAEFGFTAAMDDRFVEASVRVRTTWSDPVDVTAKLEAVMNRISKGDFAVRPEVTKIAEAHPRSLFASDVKAGYGLVAPASLIGILAATGIPAFMKYTKA